MSPCTATSTQSRQRCRRYAVPGRSVCKIHGGGTQLARAKATRVMAIRKATKDLGLPVEAEPTEALLHAVRVAAGDMLRLSEVVNDDPALVPLYERSLERPAKVSKMALDVGFDERRQRLAEAQAAAMYRVMQVGFKALKLTPEQEATARASMAAELRRIEASRS
jgi:hypothetical protein